MLKLHERIEDSRPKYRITELAFNTDLFKGGTLENTRTMVGCHQGISITVSQKSTLNTINRAGAGV